MYQVLYRKYRPKVFSDVYGQDHVTSTLKNEIVNGRVSHAYLFTGSRGTGKTTCAKILAKAVNCPESKNGEPCNECEVCKGLENGTVYDVVEIDAASNNGVDNIRELREDVKYTPTKGKYRVYIIDEVHMLSAGAYNALLKTLEEPPEHVIFILATTDVQKLPATILSRCQRFDFKRIQPETMAERLNVVSKAEGLELDSDAAVLIARIADGALRDGLSVLDQCAGRSRHITSGLVSEVAGLAGREALYQLSDCISSHNTNEAINVISSLYENSYDMERLCVEMINHFRNFLVVKTAKKSRELIVCTDDEYSTIQKSADEFTLEGVINALELFQNTLVRIKGGSAARIEVEMAFVKLCEPKLDENNSAILDRISSLERAVRNGVRVAPAEKKTAPPAPVKEEKLKEEPEAIGITEEQSEEAPASETPAAVVEPEEESAFEAAENVPEPESEAPAEEIEAAEEGEAAQGAFNQWGEFIDEIKKLDITLFGILSGSSGYIKGDVFYIESPNSVLGDFIKKNNCSRTIKQALYNVTGYKLRLGVTRRKNDSSQNRDPLEDFIARAQSVTNVEIK